MYVFLVVQRLQDTIGLGSCHNRYGINHHLKTINNITLKPRLDATRTLFVEERLPFYGHPSSWSRHGLVQGVGVGSW